MAKQSGLKASNMGDVYVKLDDAERILGEKFSMPVQVTVMQALRALPVSDGWEDKGGATRCGVCRYCLMQNWDGKGFPPIATRMVLCTDCGNKRCPKADNCGNLCTNSNEPDQRPLPAPPSD